MNKARNLKEFSIKYSGLNHNESDVFSRVISKLMRVNYLCRDLKGDRNDYHDAIAMRDMLHNYLQVMDISIIVDEVNGVFGIKMNGDEGHERLRLRESIFLLTLRKLFYIKKQSISLVDAILVTYDEILDELSTTGIFDRRMPKSEFEDILRKFKSYHICDYSAAMGPDVVIILPSILHAVNADTLDQIEAKISLYYNNTEVDEDETD